MKRVSLLFLAFVVGCGNQTSSPSSDAKPQPVSATEVDSTGKPSADEASDSIREFFSGSNVGFSNVKVERVSDPVAAPKEVAIGSGDTWACTVTMTCDNVLGDKQLNKNWLILLGREQGKAKVKDFYNDLNRIAESPLGKEWFVKNKFPEPSIE